MNHFSSDNIISSYNVVNHFYSQYGLYFVQHTLRILIVDDMDKNRQFMHDLIKSSLAECIINQAETGEDAVNQVASLISNEKVTYPLIIMDYQMPVLNGAKATEKIRALEQKANIDQPSIIITWSAALSAPFPMADDYLPKYTNKQQVAALLSCYGLLEN